MDRRWRVRPGGPRGAAREFTQSSALPTPSRATTTPSPTQAVLPRVELAEGFDLLENQFGSPGDRTPMRALNVNTIDEVPDSSWFTNRIGIRAMPVREIVRGANKFDPAETREWDTWTVVGGKGPRGFQPGFRAERPGDPGQVYQLEVDPKDHPRLATGAEFIGGLIYHALGYFVEDVYVLKVHPRNIRISEKATIRDASGSASSPLTISTTFFASLRRTPRAMSTCRPRATTARTWATSRTTAPEVTIRMTSIRMSTAASCARTASSPPGSRTTTPRALNTRNVPVVTDGHTLHPPLRA